MVVVREERGSWDVELEVKLRLGGSWFASQKGGAGRVLGQGRLGRWCIDNLRPSRWNNLSGFIGRSVAFRSECDRYWTVRQTLSNLLM